MGRLKNESAGAADLKRPGHPELCCQTRMHKRKYAETDVPLLVVRDGSTSFLPGSGDKRGLAQENYTSLGDNTETNKKAAQ